jgi:methylated-DNA-[protein]-cysteine S-methyltransferase
MGMKEPFEKIVERHGGTVLRVCRVILGVHDLPLDLSLSKGFRQLVQRHLAEIGYGQTRTYRQVAELVGSPKAVRAVGTACATNPLPVVVPCHRVLRADGTPGVYVGGPCVKKTLLSLEAAA